ncbi:cell division protein FtsK [Marmoricola endophyticus]|uniref:Cell division protein FtsK n=1 Tax=Marmoricola endophyticus TaxID=2040280 RepID=A0A917FA42_9ACTN|nr:FtsK/SpoIIIE domain-containing protein [Marmoricola endophyticus]GGF56847.1 cell division protein FtsK [Marmoricola endophyticus]
MRFVIDAEGTRHELDVSQVAEGASVADLVQLAVGTPPPAEETWWVGEEKHPAGTPLSDLTLLEGTRFAREREDRVEPIRGWAVTLSGGLHAGRTVDVPTGRPLVLGRSPQADICVDSPSMSWTHVSIVREGKSVRVSDAGSTNGTFVDGAKIDATGVEVTDEAVVVAGGAAFTVRSDAKESLAPSPGSLHNLTQSGTAPFNRPPRPGRVHDPDKIEPPTRKDPTAANKFSIAAVVAPLGLAAMMVMVSGPRFALIALMSPVIAVGTYFEGKRRFKKETAQEKVRFEKALDTLESDIGEAAAIERTRRREECPDPATTIRRAALPTTQLWQRRTGAADFLKLHVGIGDVPWKPPVDTDRAGRPDDAVKEVVAETRVPAAPIIADLSDAGVIGVVGDRAGALAVARSLLAQAAVHAGPADLTVGVFCDRGREEEWSWTTWLPHVRRLGDGSGGQWTSTDRQRSESLLRSLRDNLEGHPTPGLMLVLDSDVLTEGRDAPARTLLGRNRDLSPASDPDGTRTRVSGIVIAAHEEQLPASCTVVVTVDADAEATVVQPGDSATVEQVVLAGLDLETARRCAMDLARFEDPELVVPGAALPGLVRLPPLLGVHEISGEEITRSWGSARGIRAPIGVGEQGALTLDLVRDGPHGLVGGTTGSGKSEFLRSFVAGLAALNDPTRLTFILIDFKGGAAFAACERLPHTIGTVSNLDEQLADRALRALEAEMRYRQTVFASAGEGIDNLDAYLATKPAVPMPRLLLVVDEFAMLAKEYPDVLQSLVSVAAVGRTLGVHMILATQRPAGVVNDDILANTNLRVALRVQSRDDSSNVIGVPDASAIGRTQMGRAYIKLGQDDITPVQTALVTGRAETESSLMIDAQPVLFGREPEQKQAGPVREDAATDLDLLIDAVVEANDAAGYGPPRPVWPEPLGERVSLSVTEPEGQGDVGAMEDGTLQFAVADDPDGQRQLPAGWDMDRGNIMFIGIPGSGTSTTLSTIALTLAATYSPDELDILVLDMGTRDLAPLADLPHTAAYVGSGAANREQQIRLLKYLRAEVDKRKANPGGHRRTVLLLDGLATLKDEYDDFEGMQHLEGLYRAYADGPDVGMWTAVATTRAKAVPSAIDEVTTQKMLFRLADNYDYAAAGVPKKLAPPAIAGRCVVAETKLQAHVATPPGSLREAVAQVASVWGPVEPKPTVVGQLPDFVTVPDLKAQASLVGEPWRIPVGIRESDLQPAYCEVYENEHVLIAGPARSGKSTVLLAVREALEEGARADSEELAVWGLAGRRSPLHDAGLSRCVGEDQVAALVAAARVQRGRLVLLIDDAESFADSDQSIAGLVAANLPNVKLVVAGRADDLRTTYGHWTNAVRKSRCGMLLVPNVDYDGDLLGVSLPRKAPAGPATARGYLAQGGSVEYTQFMAPSGYTKGG